MNLIPMAVNFDGFLNFDIKLFEWVQSLQAGSLGSFLTPFFKFYTTLGDEGIVWIVLALLLLVFKKTRKTGIAMGIALVVMLVLNNLVLKELVFDRPRPFMLESLGSQYDWWAARYVYPEIVKAPSSPSFPSGHTSSAFACAFAVVFAWRKKGFSIIMLVLAALMGFSRLYIEVHYCTDVLAGALVGLIYGLIGAAIAGVVYPKIEKFIEARKAKKS